MFGAMIMDPADADTYDRAATLQSSAALGSPRVSVILPGDANLDAVLARAAALRSADRAAAAARAAAATRRT